MSRPSRSQVQVRVGSYANGTPRLSTYHWISCQVAHLRNSDDEVARPYLGRRPNPTPVSTRLTDAPGNHQTFGGKSSPLATTTNQPVKSQPAEIQTSDSLPEPRKRRRPDSPRDQRPLITRQMFDNWTPDLFGPSPSGRPVRSSRNPAPKYVDAMEFYTTGRNCVRNG